jgi:hypothetical protein
MGGSHEPGCICHLCLPGALPDDQSPPTPPKGVAKIWLHGHEGMWPIAERFGLNEKAKGMIRHAADEFEIILEIDRETGVCTPIEIDGRRILPKEKK